MAQISALCVHETTCRLVEEVAAELGMVLDVKVVPMESALVAVRAALRQGCKVLLAEDRLWQVLSEPSPLPVVFCGAGAWEVLQAISADAGDVAVMHFGPDQLGLTSLGPLVGRQIVEVICARSLMAVKEQLEQLKSTGVQCVVGGAAVVNLAKQQGFTTQLLLPGSESVRHALMVAHRIAGVEQRANNAQEIYCRGASLLPTGLMLVQDGQTIYAWGGKAVEVADRLRGLLARSPVFDRRLIERAAGPGISLEAVGEVAYLVHDMDKYERVLGREVQFNALGGEDVGEALVVSVGELDDMIAQIVVELLRRNSDNRTQVARLLGISRTTLWKRLKELPAQRLAKTTR